MTNEIRKETVQFRTKFSEQMNMFPDYLVRRIERATMDFINMKSDHEAKENLWNMTYFPFYGFKNMFLNFTNAELKYFSNNFILSFRNELRYQKCKKNENFYKNNIPAICKDEFEDLEKKSDIFTATKIYERCRFLCEYNNSAENINHILILLLSQKENNQFGGIRCMLFNKHEANYLKAYSKLIANLLYKVSFSFEITECGKGEATETEKLINTVDEESPNDLTVAPKEANIVNIL